MPEVSTFSTLRERAGLQPDDIAYTYTDYESDWNGVTETLTWGQVYRRALNVAHAVKACGEKGDRAVVLAPQGLEYISAFLGSMLGGFIAVPLPVPHAGSHDERVSAVLADTEPTVVLTTKSARDGVADYISNGTKGPAIIEVDSLDLDARQPNIRTTDLPSTAYLQYTSGSTRLPAGVMITHENLYSNFRQLMSDYFPNTAGVSPRDMAIVSWLPFYHDMGLVLGVVSPIFGGFKGDLTSPVAFLQRPARWVQALAAGYPTWSASPNFAFEMAAAKTTDEDMAGFDLSKVVGIISGSERIHPTTLNKFVDRFGKFGFRHDMMRPSYGLAEATVYVACSKEPGPPKVVHFDAEKLSAGTAIRTDSQDGIELLSYGSAQHPVVRIVDPDTRIECPSGVIGEIWTEGENVAHGYWHKPEETVRTFGGMLAETTPGTPEGPWLCTGDLGFFSEGELFIVGRMKDMLIVYGRNHYPEDIESTVQEVIGGRVAAISVTVDRIEKLAVIVELKKRKDTEYTAELFATIKNDITSAISKAHQLTAADIVLVAPGSLPTTTSGKIRRAASGDMYRERKFARLDA